MAYIIRASAVLDGPVSVQDKEHYTKVLAETLLEMSDDVKENTVKIRILTEEEAVQVDREEFNNLLNSSDIDITVSICNVDLHDEGEAFEVTIGTEA